MGLVSLRLRRKTLHDVIFHQRPPRGAMGGGVRYSLLPRPPTISLCPALSLFLSLALALSPSLPPGSFSHTPSTPLTLYLPTPTPTLFPYFPSISAISPPTSHLSRCVPTQLCPLRLNTRLDTAAQLPLSAPAAAAVAYPRRWGQEDGECTVCGNRALNRAWQTRSLAVAIRVGSVMHH